MGPCARGFWGMRLVIPVRGVACCLVFISSVLCLVGSRS